MYILTFIQNGYERPLALFESMEAGRRFMQSVPGYTVREEDGNRRALLTYCAKGIADNLRVVDKADIGEAEEAGVKVISL